jgi:hypothetical protein
MEPLAAIEIPQPPEAAVMPASRVEPLTVVEAEPLATDTTFAEDESRYPTGPKFYLVMSAVGGVLILSSIGIDILAVAVPAITDTFHTTADVGWYVAAYRLCMCAFQFMFGKLYRLYSTKRVFLASTVIFVVGSRLFVGGVWI